MLPAAKALAQLVALRESGPGARIGNDDLVMGTLDHDVWERGRRVPLAIPVMLAELHVFEVGACALNPRAGRHLGRGDDPRKTAAPALTRGTKAGPPIAGPG